MTGNELLVHKVALLLDSAQTIDETPDCGVVHLKLNLDASICSFGVIVRSLISVQDSFVQIAQQHCKGSRAEARASTLHATIPCNSPRTTSALAVTLLANTAPVHPMQLRDQWEGQRPG